MKGIPCFLCLCLAASLSCQQRFPAPTGETSIPSPLLKAIQDDYESFQRDYRKVLENDSGRLLTLVDKQHPLDFAWVPQDIEPLTKGQTYLLNRNDLSLRTPAEAALERLAQAARKEGITLVVSSTYRSYEYQKNVYERNVRQMGQAAADRESARAGTSQHHLGTAVDFGSITDDFAYTKAGIWLAANASTYGWSLSYPEGYEEITGYRYECWHFRYIGVEAARLEKKWFGGIQQYMLEYLHYYEGYR